MASVITNYTLSFKDYYSRGLSILIVPLVILIILSIMNVKIFGVCFQPDLLKLVDEKRGDISRSKFLSKIVAKALKVKD